MYEDSQIQLLSKLIRQCYRMTFNTYQKGGIFLCRLTINITRPCLSVVHFSIPSAQNKWLLSNWLFVQWMNQRLIILCIKLLTQKNPKKPKTTDADIFFYQCCMSVSLDLNVVMTGFLSNHRRPPPPRPRPQPRSCNSIPLLNIPLPSTTSLLSGKIVEGIRK